MSSLNKSSKRRKGQNSQCPEPVADDQQDIHELNSGKLSKSPLHLELLKVNFRTKDIKKLNEMNIRYNLGPFSEEENQILNKNWETFCDDFVVDQPHQVLGFYHNYYLTEDQVCQQSRDLVERSQLYLRLGLNLPNRTVPQIYQRARKLFSGLRKSNELTDENRSDMLALVKKEWKVSCLSLGFPIEADIKTVEELVRSKFNSKSKRVYNTGRWTVAEEKKFRKECRRIYRLSDPPSTAFDEICWAHLSENMATRNDHQCRKHFYTESFQNSLRKIVKRLNERRLSN